MAEIKQYEVIVKNKYTNFTISIVSPIFAHNEVETIEIAKLECIYIDKRKINFENCDFVVNCGGKEGTNYNEKLTKKFYENQIRYLNNIMKKTKKEQNKNEKII